MSGCIEELANVLFCIANGIEIGRDALTDRNEYIVGMYRQQAEAIATDEHLQSLIGKACGKVMVGEDVAEASLFALERVKQDDRIASKPIIDDYIARLKQALEEVE